MSKLTAKIHVYGLPEVRKLSDAYQYVSQEIDKLSLFISENFQDEPEDEDRDESAVDIAIRLLEERKHDAFQLSENYREG